MMQSTDLSFTKMLDALRDYLVVCCTCNHRQHTHHLQIFPFINYGVYGYVEDVLITLVG